MPDRTHHSGRFASNIGMLDIKKLEHESRSTLVLGVVVALAFQVLLAMGMQYFPKSVEVSRPPNMHLVIHRPRLNRPFIFRKQPIKERMLIRQTIIPELPEVITAITSNGLVRIDCDGGFEYDGSIPEYDICYGDTMLQPIPDTIFKLAHIERAPRSLETELITINDLDTGQYRALITIDPDNRQNTKGFVYLSMLWGIEMTPPYKRAVRHLIDAVNGLTNVSAKTDRHLFIGDERLHESPFVLISTDKAFKLSRLEAENFGKYLRNGGFAVLDNGDPANEISPAEASLKQSVRDALGTDARFLPIPNDHGIYHSFFDFDYGPPQGQEFNLVNIAMSPDTSYAFHETTLPKAVYFLEGVFLDDRLVAVYSDKGYAECWNKLENNTSQIRMGVNLVMFALTQKNGITQQRMDFLAFDNLQGIDREEAALLGAISNRLAEP